MGRRGQKSGHWAVQLVLVLVLFRVVEKRRAALKAVGVQWGEWGRDGVVAEWRRGEVRRGREKGVWELHVVQAGTGLASCACACGRERRAQHGRVAGHVMTLVIGACMQRGDVGAA